MSHFFPSLSDTRIAGVAPLLAECLQRDGALENSTPSALGGGVVSKGRRPQRAGWDTDHHPSEGRKSPTPRVTGSLKGLSEGSSAARIITSCKQLMDIADQLSHSLVDLRGRLAKMQERLFLNDLRKGTAGVGVQAKGNHEPSRRRQKQSESERAKLEVSIAATSKATSDIVVAARVVERLLEFRTMIFSRVKDDLQQEISELELALMKQSAAVHDGFVERIALLKRYWEWREEWERGEVPDGLTFAEELARGPRYTSIGVQNNIRTDHMELQMRWLKQLIQLEDNFQSHVVQLSTLLHDLDGNSDVITTLLTCPVCGLFLEEPVACWPCGHTFCLECSDSLMVSPSLYRCYTCGSFGTEGFVHNILIAETLAKWEFKETGYADVHGALARVEIYLDKFRRDAIEDRIAELQDRMDRSSTGLGSPEALSATLSDDSSDSDM